jgi:hypothetical protein
LHEAPQFAEFLADACAGAAFRKLYRCSAPQKFQTRGKRAAANTLPMQLPGKGPTRIRKGIDRRGGDPHVGRMNEPPSAKSPQLADTFNNFRWKLPIEAQHHDSPD